MQANCGDRSPPATHCELESARPGTRRATLSCLIRANRIQRLLREPSVLLAFGKLLISPPADPSLTPSDRVLVPCHSGAEPLTRKRIALRPQAPGPARLALAGHRPARVARSLSILQVLGSPSQPSEVRSDSDLETSWSRVHHSASGLKPQVTSDG